MPVIIKRENQLGNALMAGAQGFVQGQEMKRQRKRTALEDAKLQAEIAELERKTQAFGAGGAIPEGFIQDPISGGLKSDPKFVTPYQQKRMEMMGGDSGLTAGQRLQKDKATQDIFSVAENNALKRQQIQDARTALPNAPQGLMGKLKVEYAKRFNPNDPMLADWQKIKTIGTDAQLLNTARTKGAISDREMALFATAAANDDLLSAPRLKPILDRIEAALGAEEAAKFGAYEKSYGEDPRTFLGLPQRQPVNLPQRAQAGYQVGQVINSNGKQYRIIGGDPNDPDVEPV